MKPIDPTPEQYVKWIMDNTCDDIWFTETKIMVVKFILTELLDNEKSEIGKVFFNECLNELKKL